MEHTNHLCDKEGCKELVRATLTVWDKKGTGVQMEFCDKHLGDISRIILATQKVTHE